MNWTRDAVAKKPFANFGFRLLWRVAFLCSMGWYPSTLYVVVEPHLTQRGNAHLQLMDIYFKGYHSKQQAYIIICTKRQLDSV